MEFRVEVLGLDKIDRAAARVREAVAREIASAVYLGGKKVERAAKESILNGQKSGRVYRKSAAVTHRASAPGEAPASDTGRLVNSIATELQTATGSAVAEVKAGGGIVKYARMLEFGTSKMPARPFLFPALEKNKAWIAERIHRAVRKAAIDAGRK